MDRTILHCDMNNFYASVELLDYPELAGEPVAICGDPKNRHGIIVAKNQIAKSFGVKTAEPLWQAQRKCPGLRTIPPHHRKYEDFYRKINAIYGRFTDMVEPFSIDESWLDVTASRNLFGDGKQIADTIRKTVTEELGLTLSAGVSFNKFFAKMGSEYKKPNATTVISRENFRELLWPLPIEEMFMVGKATAAKLRANGITTIAELAHADRLVLSGMLGKNGDDLVDFANGIDNRPVALASERRKLQSIGHGMTFSRNLTSEDDIRTGTLALSDKATARLRRHLLKAGGVKIEIKDPDFRVISRQTQLAQPTDHREVIYQTALSLIHEAMHRTARGNDLPIRLLTVTCINLTDREADEQLSFFDAPDKSETREKRGHLNTAMDDIRDKFGSGAITYGRVLNNDIGINVETYAEHKGKDKEPQD